MASSIAVEVVLSEPEREQLVSWSRRRTSAQALATRSRIVLAVSSIEINAEVLTGAHVNVPRLASNRPAIAAPTNVRGSEIGTDRPTAQRETIGVRRSAGISAMSLRASQALTSPGRVAVRTASHSGQLTSADWLVAA